MNLYTGVLILPEGSAEDIIICIDKAVEQTHSLFSFTDFSGFAFRIGSSKKKQLFLLYKVFPNSFFPLDFNFVCVFVIYSSSPCQNGGTCIDDNGFAPHASCLCPSGFAGNFCEIDRDDCESNPCENGGTCADVGVGFSCSCPHGYTGKLCSSRVTVCASGPCENGGTCSEHPQGGFECICKPEFVGMTCKHPSKNISLSGMNMETKHMQNYKPPSKAHHRSVHQQQEILKITVKETIQNADPLLSRSQVVCFVVLGLLTCLVVLGTTGIVFFSKCEMWLANAKYSHLLRKKKNFFLKSNNGENLSVNIIFPEKIKLTNYTKNYTAI